MAKRKKRRKKQPLKNNIKKELIGLLLVFLAIFGSGATMISDGAISSLLENIFRFFFGTWYFIVSLFLLFIGIYLMVKRKWPNLSTRKWIGTYLVLAGFILMTHILTFQEAFTQPANYPSITVQSFTFYKEYIQGERTATYLGGGMFAAILFAISNFLFSSAGAKFFAVFIMLIGVIIFSNLSIGDLFSSTFHKLQEKLQLSKQRFVEWKEKRKETDTEEENNDVLLESDQDTIESELPAIAYANEDLEVMEQVDDEQVETIDVKELEEKEETKQDKWDTSESDQLPTTTEFENQDYQLPLMNILELPKNFGKQQDKTYIQRVVRKLEKTFQSFGVKARVTKVHVGPSVTKYEVYPEAGVKVSKIVNLNDDLALALAAKDIRIEAPIPGKSAVGIEVPNEETAMVTLREVLETKKNHIQNKLAFALGKDIAGESVIAELNKMPHILVAGATGSGKSVCINGIITSILMRAKPHEVKMMMIDPKKVELNVYNGIPHLLTPVVTDPKKAARALKKVVAEMERRYDLFSETGTRNIEGYNEYIKRHNAAEEDQQPQLPYIVVIVDELADLMMVASNEVEDAITRLAQMARAAGIHLIIATQRPSVDVITGVIKANIPSRIAFSVSSQTDSRTILDSGGAEKLLGRGDMLFIPVGLSKPVRIQGAFLSDEEVERVVDHCVEQQKAQYQEEMIPEEETEVVQEVDDDLFDDAVQLVLEMQSASVSMLQRRFRIGYTRAARLIDAMEDRGIVGPYEGSKPRTVLQSQMSDDMTANSSS
ncbi:cell division protein FtsK [Gracilibacillus salitolerans]|uniref:Cell division protein FtsK n=1 Tax=Gracilibacillus salitolerans TaxID=2663022 RepID=A0A5Q2TKJ1_9BACI|nr:DNA translocase FtsK [Gracilibacillus salitolerans]QGH34592.1 cell division protein FtsK [Gracilibacillus salitolerans]